MREGWQTKTLGEVLQKTETIKPLQAPEAEFDYIDVSSVSNTTFKIEATQRLKGKDAPSRARRRVKSSDVLFATVRPTLRRIAIVPEYLDNQVCSTGYFVLRPKAGVDHRFVFYSLFTEDFMEQMESLQKGASYPAVTDGEVRAQKIPLPPLSEQKRIVAILDEAFAGIATAIANTEKNLANARELFESYLNNVFIQKGEGWAEKKLGDIATFRNGLNFTKNSKGELIKIVGVKDFQNDFWVPMDQLQSVRIDGELSELDALQNGDILTVRSNGNKDLIGRCILADQVPDKISHSGFTIRIRIKTDEVYHPYMVHFLKSKESRKQLTEIGGGVNISSLNQQGLSSLMISYPSFSDQKTIVAKIDDLSSETHRLESLYQHKLVNLADLKQSLLHKAFSGALTSQSVSVLQEAVA